VDEFQNFATASFINILSEARKYRLNLTLANQYLGQLEEMTAGGSKSTQVLDAVFGNVGTIVLFRVGAEDAEFLEREFLPEFEAADLVNLGKYNIYLKLMVDGIAERPFSAQALPPAQKLEVSNREKIIKVSRERYGTRREIVEEKIAKWTGVIKSLPQVQSAPPQPGGGTILYDAKCAICGRDTKVIFPPDGKRPIYCKSCLNKQKQKAQASKDQQFKSQSAPSALLKPPAISLQEALKTGPVSFSPKKPPLGQEMREKPKRKEVNVEELKKILEESLNQAENKIQSGEPKNLPKAEDEPR